MNSQDLHSYILNSLKNRGFSGYSYTSFCTIAHVSQSLILIPISTNEFSIIQEFEGIETAVLKSEDKIELYKKTGEESIYPIKPLHKGQVCLQVTPILNQTQIIIQYIIITPEHGGNSQ